MFQYRENPGTGCKCACVVRDEEDSRGYHGHSPKRLFECTGKQLTDALASPVTKERQRSSERIRKQIVDLPVPVVNKIREMIMYIPQQRFSKRIEFTLHHVEFTTFGQGGCVTILQVHQRPECRLESNLTPAVGATAKNENMATRGKMQKGREQAPKRPKGCQEGEMPRAS